MLAKNKADFSDKSCTVQSDIGIWIVFFELMLKTRNAVGTILLENEEVILSVTSCTVQSDIGIWIEFFDFMLKTRIAVGTILLENEEVILSVTSCTVQSDIGIWIEFFELMLKLRLAVMLKLDKILIYKLLFISLFRFIVFYSRKSVQKKNIHLLSKSL